MVALLRETPQSIQRPEPMPSLAPKLRLVPTDPTPLRLDLENSASVVELFEIDANLNLAAYEQEHLGEDTESHTEKHTADEFEPAITPLFAVVTALLILALLSFVRISQGAPPASSWDSLAPTPAPATAPGVGETVRIVDVGDTLWAIAAEIAPEVDRRVAVDALADRNGGSAILVGQRLVVPVELVSS